MISNLSQQSWDAKVIELGGSILQSWKWGEFQESLNQKIYRFSDNDFAAQAIESSLSLGKKYIYVPRGPLGNVDRALVDFKQFQSNREIIFTRLEPNQVMKLPKALKDIQPVNNWVLDLEKTEVEILAGMKPKTRYNINLAQRKGVTVRIGEQKDLIIAWQLFLETATRNKIKLHPQNYYFKMWEHLHPDGVKILIAEYQGVPLAAMLLTLFGNTATYLHGGTSLKFKESMAPYMLHWEAIRLAKLAGYKNYDFGGIAPNDDPNHSWAGITRFKKSFGGFTVTYPGAFDLIYSPIWYNVYKQARVARKILRSS